MSERLPLEHSVDTLLRSLSAACLPLFDFQRVTLFLAAAVPEPAVLYCLTPADPAGLQEDVASMAEYSLIPTQEQTRCLSRLSAFTCDGQTLRRDTPALAELEPYRHALAYLHLPLMAQGKLYGALQFVRTQETPFTENIVTLCRILAGVVGPSLGAILTTQSTQRELDNVRRERDHFSILVDVTNTAIGTLEMDTMVHIVTRELRRYCGLGAFALLLLDKSAEAQTFTLYEDADKEHTHATPHAHYPLVGSVLQQALAKDHPMALSLDDLSRCTVDDPVPPFLRAQECACAYIFRLHFANRLLGAMVLAHTHTDIFTLASLRLLEQIAARVAIAVHNAQEYAALHVQRESLVQENLYLCEQIDDNISSDTIIGKSAGIRHVLEQVDMVAGSDSTVLLLGETGTGKELLALAIHNRSARSTRRMIKMNCAAMPAGLLESELFGHEKGSFTGAGTQRKGRFELAHGSTFMLDEVGDIPLELQPKLLRVLQSREIERLGGSRVIPVDVRLVAATNRNLQEMVRNNTFRDDLYYRLNVFPILIPPLRERREDIPLLAQYYARKISRRMKRDITHIPAEAMTRLCNHAWPGNVRELANVIERAVILSPGSSLNLYPLEAPPPAPPAPLYRTGHNGHMANKGGDGNGETNGNGGNGENGKTPSHNAGNVEAMDTGTIPKMVHPQPDEGPSERQCMITALMECNGVVAGPRGAAAKLGLKRTTLLSRMQRMGINVRDILDNKG